MNAEPRIRFACSEEFAELCALSTTGSLTAEERVLLEKHIAVCDQCRALVADYESLASDGMAKLAAEFTSDE
jgi:anti-sigma factor ChrR (cupin superfamily)